MDNTETTVKTSNSKITEAFELLNEAAKEKRHEMKELMTDRYSHIKQAVLDGAIQGKKILDNAQHVAQEAIAESGEKVKKAAKEVDKRVHENPWPYLGGVAVVSLILGDFMGSKRK
jgi:ElaB/YqjD/DUF883 family membrane-anchored ribosome-binding protein